ncbi:16998_t:CDS:2, partial [Cetraspora pellucida]
FAIRLDNTEKSLGVTIRAEIVCCHAGITNTEYHMKYVNLEHNYLMDTAVAVFDPGHHKLSNSKNNQVLMLYNSGIPSHNHVKGLSEISQLLSNLHNKTEYLITYSVKNNKLHCLFFSTHSALMRFENYLEVVLIDSTYKTNHFGMSLFLISGVDAMQAASNTVNRIQLILTDKDLALLSAIRAEMSYVKHQICTWHIEQNIVRNLSSKLKEKFVALSRDFKMQLYETMESIAHMWAHCYINKYVNYGIRTTQCSEASNTYLKRLLGHIASLPELITITHQQCPEILKSVSTAISDFIYSLLFEQYNKAKAYNVQEQEENLIRKSLSVNYIGFCWVIKLNNTTNIMQLEEQPEQDDINDNNLSIDVLSSTAFEIPINQELTVRSTADLLKKIETISNRVGHVEINSSLANFVDQLNEKYPLLQADIQDPANIKTKGRPGSTKYNKTGAEHASKRAYICGICNSTGHNSRSCPSKLNTEILLAETAAVDCNQDE